MHSNRRKIDLYMECVRCDRVNEKEQNKKQQNQLIPGKVVKTTEKTTHTHTWEKKYVEFISGYNESTEEVKKRQQENKKKIVCREETKIKIINPKAAGENVFPQCACVSVYVISFVWYEWTILSSLSFF